MGAYLDNAATSWPKPEAVYQAVDHFMRKVGATPGRGGHRREEEAQRIADEARETLARLFHAPDPQGVAFMLNATQAINMALKGLLHPGDHVITSSVEHNALWRPLKALARRGVKVTAVPCAPDGTLNPADVEAALRPGTRLVTMLHASNVLGTILPLAEVGEITRRHGALFLVDAAQTAGAYPIDMEAMHIDMLAFAGHKGTFGPHGTGGLVVRPGVELETWVEGGSGVESASETMAGGRDAERERHRRAAGRRALRAGARCGPDPRPRDGDDRPSDRGTAGRAWVGRPWSARPGTAHGGRLRHHRGLFSRPTGRRAGSGVRRGDAGRLALCAPGPPRGGDAGLRRAALQPWVLYHRGRDPLRRGRTAGDRVADGQAAH